MSMITLVAALDRRHVIGLDGGLPWHLPADLRHFKALTRDHTIIMGRKTYESLPMRPLPYRRNLVVTSQIIPGVECFNGVVEAVEFARSLGREAFVIGGSTVYRQSIEIADRMVLTHVIGEYEGDTFFPEIGNKWLPRTILERSEEFVIVDYRKKA